MLATWLLDVLVEEEHDCNAGFVGVEPSAQKAMNIVLGFGSVGCCAQSLNAEMFGG